MKILKLILLVMFASFISLTAQEKEGNEKQAEIRYILFDNMEKAYDNDGGGGEVINYFELTYDIAFSTQYLPPKKMEFATKMALNGNFYSLVNIDDLRVVIMPIGDHALQDNVGGISLISLIKNLMANDVGVILHGRKWLRKAFRDAPDTEVQQFLKDVMGIEGFRELPLLDGNTWKGFWNMGRPEDPVSNNFTHECNMGADHGFGFGYPVMYYNSIDLFTVNEAHPHAVSTNFVHWERELDYTKVVSDDQIGVRSESDGTRICMYTYSHDIEALIVPRDAFNQIRDGFAWIERNMLWPEPWLETSSANLDFGGVPVGESKTLDFYISNRGEGDLYVTDAFIDDFDVEPQHEGAYEIVSGEITSETMIKSNESHKLEIKFTPVDELFHSGSSIVIAADNADNLTFGEKVVDINGKGGEAEVQGARYYTTPEEILDFGGTPVGDTLNRGIWVVSTGSIPAQIDELEVIDDGDGSFSFLTTEDSKVPKVIYPGDSIQIMFNFNGVDAETEYIGKVYMRFQSAPEGLREKEITLIGETVGESIKLEYDREEIILMDVRDGESKTGTVTLYTNNSAFIDITEITLTEDGNGNFTLPDAPYDLPISINVNSDFLKINVKFEPTEGGSGTYTGELLIKSTATNMPELRVSLSGEFVSGIKEDMSVTSDGMFSIKANPNPIGSGKEATLGYTLNSTTSKYVDIYAVDVNGNRVLDIFKGNINPGTANLPLRMDKLASGGYTIMAEIDGQAVMVSIIVIN